jgi:hypothetical protein
MGHERRDKEESFNTEGPQILSLEVDILGLEDKE